MWDREIPEEQASPSCWGTPSGKGLQRRVLLKGQPLSSPVPGELSEGTRWWAGLRGQAGSLKILGQCVGPESTPPAF